MGKKKDNIFQTIGLLTQLGILMIVSIGIGYWFGSLIDNFIGESIIFRLVGILLGVISGFYSNYRLIKGYIDNNKDSSK
ncbi:MAG: AtpZ/AtpI family protein [Halanaerobiales bacterium]